MSWSGLGVARPVAQHIRVSGVALGMGANLVHLSCALCGLCCSGRACIALVL